MPSSGRSFDGGSGSCVSTCEMMPQVVVGAERHLAGEALVEHHAQRPDVDAVVEVLLAARLLGRHVERRPEQQAGVRQPIALAALVARPA